MRLEAVRLEALRLEAVRLEAGGCEIGGCEIGSFEVGGCEVGGCEVAGTEQREGQCTACSLSVFPDCSPETDRPVSSPQPPPALSTSSSDTSWLGLSHDQACWKWSPFGASQISSVHTYEPTADTSCGALPLKQRKGRRRGRRKSTKN